MSTRTYRLNFAGAGTATLPGGVFFYLKAATAALELKTRGSGSTTAPIEFSGVGAGLKFGPVPSDKRWTYLDVTSAVAQVVDVIVSDDAEVDISSTVTVSGQVQVVETPATSVSDVAPVSTTASQTVPLFAVNAARRGIRVFVHPNNPNFARARRVGNTNYSAILQPGSLYDFDGTYAMEVTTEADAGSYIFNLHEET